MRFLQRAEVRNVNILEQTTGVERKQRSIDRVDSRPCKKRNDGAPDVPIWEESPRLGHPPEGADSK